MFAHEVQQHKQPVMEISLRRLCELQGRPAQLGKVVRSLKRNFQLHYVYCWHGLPAYWSGVALPREAPGVAKYEARKVFAEPTRGLYEIDPSAAWNPTVISGVGVVDNVSELYTDMHRYLADAGAWAGPPYSPNTQSSGTHACY